MVSRSVSRLRSVTGLTRRRDTVYEYDRADPQDGIRNWIRRRRLDVRVEHRACLAVKKKQHHTLRPLGSGSLQGKAYENGHVLNIDTRGDILDEIWQRMSNDRVAEKNTLALFIIRFRLVEKAPTANERAPQRTIQFGMRSTLSGASDSDPRTRSAMIVHPGLVLFSW